MLEGMTYEIDEDCPVLLFKWNETFRILRLHISLQKFFKLLGGRVSQSYNPAATERLKEPSHLIAFLVSVLKLLMTAKVIVEVR